MKNMRKVLAMVLAAAMLFSLAACGEKGENTALLEKMAIQAQELAEEPEDTVSQLNQWKSNIAALGTWLVTVSEMPLEVDAILLSGDYHHLIKTLSPTLSLDPNYLLVHPQ